MKEFTGPYVPHIGGGGHPNGTVFLCVTKNPPGANTPPVLEIWRYDPGAAALKPITTLGFSGPAGYGTVICQPDGSLFVASSAGLKDADRVGGNFQTLPNMAQPWKVEGTVVLLPPPSQGAAGTLDQTARTTASAAQTAATKAQSTADDAKKIASGANTAVKQVQQALDGLKTLIPSPDTIWQQAGNRIGAELDNPKSPLVNRIGQIAQQKLLDAIAYAKTAKGTSSMLRGLVEQIIGEMARA